jgi:hypothetical protein
MAIVVVFGENGARIIKNPANFSELVKLPNVVVDPDLSALKGTAPHLWRLEKGKIVVSEEVSPHVVTKRQVILHKLKPYVIGLLLGLLLGVLLGKL